MLYIVNKGKMGRLTVLASLLFLLEDVQNHILCVKDKTSWSESYFSVFELIPPTPIKEVLLLGADCSTMFIS